MSTEAQRKASAKYDREHTKSILLKLNTTSDADILAKLDEVGNKQGYIKELVRGDISGDNKVLTIDSIKLLLLPVVNKYGVRKAILFGSYARGDATEKSDLDILIDCDGIKDMDDYLSLTESIRKATGKNVDVVMADALDSDDTRRGKRLKEHIESEGVVVYERDK